METRMLFGIVFFAIPILYMVFFTEEKKPCSHNHDINFQRIIQISNHPFDRVYVTICRKCGEVIH